MTKFEKYQQNLRQEGNFIISYYTKVAEIKGNELHQLGWWSVTTQKHINYAAKELGLTLIDFEYLPTDEGCEYNDLNGYPNL